MQRRQIPSLNWLRVFEAAARHENLSRAARELAMSPAAVSQQVSALEVHLGRKLFIRSANRVALSPVGEAFLPTVRLSLSSLEAKADTLFRSKGSVRVTVETSQLMAMSWLPRRLAAFEAAHTNFRTEIRIEGQAAANGSSEPVALSIRFGMPQDFPRSAKELMSLHSSVVGSPSLVERVRSTEDLLEFRLFDVALHAQGWAELLANTIDPSRLKGSDIVAVDSTPLAFMMAAEGLGFAITHTPVCDRLVQALGLVPVDTVPKMKVPGSYFLGPGQNEELSPEAELMIDFLLREAL